MYDRPATDQPGALLAFGVLSADSSANAAAERIERNAVTVQFAALSDEVELQTRVRELSGFEAEWIRAAINGSPPPIAGSAARSR